MANTPDTPQPILIGSAQIQLQNVQLRDDVLLDEVNLDGGDVRLEPPMPDGEGSISTGETRIRAVLSEPNLNRLLAANMPADAPVRNLQVALLSGKARISGQVIKMISLPFSLEAVLRIENGVRVALVCQNASAGGIGIPSALVEVIQQQINDHLRIDLSTLPIPIWLDEARCDPGRLTAIGRARIIWPPAGTATAPSPFSARPLAPSIEPVPAAAPLAQASPARAALEAGPVQEVPGDSAPVLPS